MKETTRLILAVIIIYIIIAFIAGISYKTHINNYEEEYVKEQENPIEIVEKYINVWTIGDADIKDSPNANSKNVGIYYWNTEIPVTYIDDNYAKIKGTEYYVDRINISENSNNFTNCDVPKNNGIKSYMDYKHITSKSSNQYKLQQIAYTGDYGIRMVNGRYCVALGSYYTITIGQYVDIELENGNIIKAILGDCKADKHTDVTNRMNPNGSVVEFVVDTDYLDEMARKMGDISYVNDWNSKVVNIKVYDKVENF